MGWLLMAYRLLPYLYGRIGAQIASGTAEDEAGVAVDSVASKPFLQKLL
jgi:hypothetical protein